MQRGCGAASTLAGPYRGCLNGVGSRSAASESLARRYPHDNDSAHRRPDIAKRTANRGHVCVPCQRDSDGLLLLGGWPDHGGVRLELKSQALVDRLQLFLDEFELPGQKFDLAILGLLDNLQFLSRSVAFADQSPVVLDHRFPAGDVKLLVARIRSR